MFESLLQKICSNESQIYSEKKCVNIVQIMCDSPVVDSTTLLAFCKFSLNYILSHNPVLKASQAISDQHKWSFKNSNTCFVSTVRKVKCYLFSNLSNL
ncbi:Fanconi anemia group A protein-like [Centruroides sculpturatus]|uniref:Fanconi anemia group A protein-like n=1 Tax=Centruroides sculpturatus TaxID=218467 RepID=UPI000C6E6322|nr:Fanconi anemia group A protein-like [Centruroides sculpturatus]